MGDPRFAQAGVAVGIVVTEETIATAPPSKATADWISAMIKAGQTVLGYVPSCDGSVGPQTTLPNHAEACPLAPGSADSTGGDTIQARINSLHANYPNLSGIYLDQGPLDDGSTKWSNKVQGVQQTTQQNYIADVAAIHAADPAWKVEMEAAGDAYPWIPTLVDYALVWEGAASKFPTFGACEWDPPDQGSNCHPKPKPGWWNSTKKIAVSICGYKPGDSTLPSDMQSVKGVFQKAWSNGAGFLYLTDLNAGPDAAKKDCNGPLGVPPSYWGDEVAAAK